MAETVSRNITERGTGGRSYSRRGKVVVVAWQPKKR